MPKNFDTMTDAMVNAALADLPTAGKLYFALIEENEASVDVSDEWADLTQVGTQSLSRTSLTCSGREVDCGVPMVFSAVGGGEPRAVAVLSDAPASSPDLWAVMDVNDGSIYDMDTLLDLAVDSLIIRWAYEGET